MPRAVHKFGLDRILVYGSIDLPKGAQILHIETQPLTGEPQLWALVDTSAPLEPFGIVVRGTGHTFDGTEGRHLGTALMDGGRLVWHFFERA